MAIHFTITPGIENRLRAWNEMAQRQPKEKEALPCITISREFGCQAYPLAEALHKRLNDLAGNEEQWIVLDRLLLEKIAEESGIAKSELQYITRVNPTFQSMITTFVGREIFRSSGMVSTPRPYVIVAPFKKNTRSTIRWRMWDKGRKLRVTSDSSTGMTLVRALAFENRLLWVRTTPLGSPVVPEV